MSFAHPQNGTNVTLPYYHFYYGNYIGLRWGDRNVEVTVLVR